MAIRINIVLVMYCLIIAVTEAMEIDGKVEARGKKKKIGLFIFFADLVIKKIFVLKLIYAFVFWVLLHKAGYFLSWFVSYLKDQKHEHYEHDHVPHHHYEYSPPYGAPSYQPYRRQIKNDLRD